MTSYLPLLALDVLHAFYPEGRCGELQFEPSAATARWLQSTNAVSRSLPGRLEVLVPDEQLARWAGSEARMSWAVRLRAPGFIAFTAGLPALPGSAFFFDGSTVRPADDGGAPWLHAGVTAGTEDTRCGAALDPGQTDVPPRERLQPRRGGLPADFVISLPWSLLRQGSAAFRIAFAARAPVWKYCLLGDWLSESPNSALQIVDLAQQALFTDPVPERLDNGETALAIRSTEALALSLRSDRRFQLRSREKAVERVLVKRLPVAGADHFARETIHGVPTLVSEIYVHR